MMVQKVRVFKLAAELGVENDVMVSRIQNLGFAVRNYMSALNVEDAQRVRRLLEREREKNTVEEHIRPTVVRRRNVKGAAVKPTKIRPPKIDKTEKDDVRLPSRPAAKPIKEIVQGSVVSEVALNSSDVVSTQENAKVQVPKQKMPKRKMPKQVAGQVPKQVAEQVSKQAPKQVAEQTLEQALTSLAMPEQFAKEHGTKFEEAQKNASLKPASEAPLIRRRIQDSQVSNQGSGQSDRAGKRGKGPRRRQVESEAFAPAATPRRGGTPFGGASGRKRRMPPGKKGKKTEITVPKASKRVIKVEGQVTLQDLAKRMSVKSTELLMKLIGLGMAGININSTLDIETSKIVAEEFGYDVQDVAVEEEDLLLKARVEKTEEDQALREVRAPIVTMMGHVDHGKTSLLDAIRKTKVADGEAGGITQHIGAYRVKTKSGMITFIDTPGHAAFTAMRARGANVTDISIIVCAADDGVMPQTIEAIDHARAAKCPIIVAINKCDLPGADVERTKRMLMEQNIIPEELGGDIIIVEVSAKTGAGLDKLLEMILLQAEVMEISANPNRSGAGVVLEAYLDRGRGPVANILVQEGTLKRGDIMVAGAAFGKIRAISDEHGAKTSDATPSVPVEVLGLSAVPAAGDTFDVVSDIKVAEKVAHSRADKNRASTAASAPAKLSLEALYLQMQGEEQAELKLVIKSDVQGTMEAIKDALIKLSGDKVKVIVVHASVGGITESDVLLASTVGGIIIGFNVRPAGKARRYAEEHGVEIKLYSIIYEAVDAVKAAMLGLLAPTIEEEALGTAEVRNTFRIPKMGTIAGSYVTSGKVVRGARARLIRDSVQIWEGKIGSLRRFKDDAKEVASGFECGISFDGYNDIKVNDVIEFYVEKEVKATLE